jgi:ribonuclease P protein component
LHVFLFGELEVENTLTTDERFHTSFDYHVNRKYGVVAHGKHVTITVSKRVGKNKDKTRLGVVVSTKVSKSSPRRHELKRWTREVFRNTIKHEVRGYDVVVSFKTNPTVDHATVDAEIVKVFRKAMKRWRDCKGTVKKS